jgi:putative hydrolase of the HAD superfamily
MVRIISFDMDGTLVDEEFDRLIWDEEVPRCYAERYGISIAAAKKHCFAEYKRQKGHGSWTSLDFWFRHFGIGDYESIIEKNKDKIIIYPDALEVLERLRRDYILIVITQAPKEFIDIKLKPLKKYFDKIYSSTHNFQKLRKDEEVYRHIMKDLKASPSDILHVGNHKDYDYDIPMKLGIKCLFLDREKKIKGIKSIKDLKEISKYL